MENYIALLLLVAPGFMAYTVGEKLGDNEEMPNNLMLTLRVLVYSVFVLLLNYIVIAALLPLEKVADIQNLFRSASFVVRYILLTLVSSITVGATWGCIRRYFYEIVNLARLRMGRTRLNERTVFNSTFDDGNFHVVKIEKDGKETFGAISSIGDNGKHELKVVDCSEWEANIAENPETYRDIKCVYYDFDKGYKITEFNIEINEDS